MLRSFTQVTLSRNRYLPISLSYEWDKEGKAKSASDQLILSGFHSVFPACMFALGSTGDQNLHSTGSIPALCSFMYLSYEMLPKCKLFYLSGKGTGRLF